MDDKKIAKEIAQLCRDIHRETRGKKRPNTVVCHYDDISCAMNSLVDDFVQWAHEHRDVIGLRPSAPGTVINHNNYSLKLRSPDITLALR